MAEDKKQLGEPAGPEGYVKNMNALIYYCNGVALDLDPIANMGNKVTNGDNLWRQVTYFVPGGGFSSSMAGRYLLEYGKKNALSSPVDPKTHLSLALYLHIRVKGRWGPTKQDAWKSLCCWLYWGPEANPGDMPRNWAALCSWPPLEKVEVDLSKPVREIKAALPTYTEMEILELLQAFAERARLNTEYRLQGVGPAPEPEPAPPEPPCHDDKPLPSFLLSAMGHDRPDTSQARSQIVSALAKQSKLDAVRCRAILCGEMPHEDELDNLAVGVGIRPGALRAYIKDAGLVLASQDA